MQIRSLGCASAGKPWNDVLNGKRRGSPSSLCVLKLDLHTLLVINGAFHVLQFLCANYLPQGYHSQLGTQKQHNCLLTSSCASSGTFSSSPRKRLSGKYYSLRESESLIFLNPILISLSDRHVFPGLQFQEVQTRYLILTAMEFQVP